MSDMELLQERYELMKNRLIDIADTNEKSCFGRKSAGNCLALNHQEQEAEALTDYFKSVSRFLIDMGEEWDWIQQDGLNKASVEQLKQHNHKLYEDILPCQYQESYANPVWAVKKLGGNFGSLLSFLYYEMRSLIGFIYEQRLEAVVIRMELFVEVYGAFVFAWQEYQKLPDYEEIRKILYWYAFDYADMAAEERVREQVEPQGCFAVGVLENADLQDIRYLFRYGEYITDNEIQTAQYLASLPQETIDLIADTFTEGYRKGFELTGKDLSRKQTVELRYSLGFERVIQKAIKNFAALGLRPVVSRPAYSILYHPTLYKSGFVGAYPNKQYDYDHKDDKALLLNKAYVNRRLEVLRTAYEKYRSAARLYAGPAVMETFGEAKWAPENKQESVQMIPAQQELWVDYRSQSGQIQREYILEEERSFTIIAFPIPEIGENFPEIFQEMIRINTLDYNQYLQIQQTIIDELDQAQCCVIKGQNGNRTNLCVRLCHLKDPSRETIFENCVSDVNIPVGEVFTSPVLKGTNGVLHVKHVFLNGLEYHNLAITFENGMIKDYTCDNFTKEEENRRFIQENILYHQKTLPLGEFAIGTNTTAYMAARKYKIEDKLPILIAEKMGPHFAVGDTCYSHAEDIAVYNPNGKEIIARDNEVSVLRRTDQSKAYFNCHTDITIPYDELGELSAVRQDESRHAIIENGRFVLPGCEQLNTPLYKKI